VKRPPLPSPFSRPASGFPDGNDAVIAFTTRIRLARNLADLPFPSRLTATQRREVARRAGAACAECRPALLRQTSSMDRLSPLDRRLLLEWHLISREMATAATGALLEEEDGRVSLMLNEEDHLRLQVLTPGLDLPGAFREADDFDTALAQHLPFAFDAELGFLTACPSNAGTGLRASVMLHLPALMVTGAVEGVARAAGRLKLAVRGCLGEGSEPWGNLFQVSNQSTLGEAETAILERLQGIVERLIRAEEAARQQLLTRNTPEEQDRLGRAFGILAHARRLGTQEAMNLLSLLLLGAELGWFPRLRPERLRRLLLEVQSGQIQLAAGRELSPPERDEQRARLTRAALADAART